MKYVFMKNISHTFLYFINDLLVESYNYKIQFKTLSLPLSYCNIKRKEEEGEQKVENF